MHDSTHIEWLKIFSVWVKKMKRQKKTFENVKKLFTSDDKMHIVCLLILRDILKKMRANHCLLWNVSYPMCANCKFCSRYENHFENQKHSSGPVECSFDNPTEKIPKKNREVLAQCPKVVKKYFFTQI